VLNGFSLRTLSIYGQFRNKIIFYPIIEGAYVNTKNWYRKGTDLWAEFGRRVLLYGPPWAHYLGGYQDRLLGGPLGLPDLCRTIPVGVRRKDHGGEVLG
jgi:hypothetical protein